jgi:hypothetical protein
MAVGYGFRPSRRPRRDWPDHCRTHQVRILQMRSPGLTLDLPTMGTIIWEWLRSEGTPFRSRKTKMRCELLLSRLLLAVTLVVTALILAPTGAQAHAGHSHAVQPAATPVQRAANLEVIQVAAITVQDEVTISRKNGGFASLVPTSGRRTPQSCPGGCCHSAGTGCCAVWLPPSAAILVPTVGRLPTIISAIGGSGIMPGALPEPPNSLV